MDFLNVNKKIVCNFYTKYIHVNKCKCMSIGEAVEEVKIRKAKFWKYMKNFRKHFFTFFVGKKKIYITVNYVYLA